MPGEAIRKFILKYLPFFAGLLGGLYYITTGALGPDLMYYPGDFADARFNNYLLEHAYQFFCGKVHSYWDAPFMYPEKNVISYSDNLLGTAPFYCVFRMLHYDRETSFQLWYLVLTILNYASCYFLLRYLVKNYFAAALGAMVFAFSIGLQSQIGHAQTFPRFIIPVAIWMALVYFKELRAKYFFLMLLCVVYEIYCGIYLGFMLAVPIGILIILSFFLRRGLYKIRIRDAKWRRYILFSIILNGLVLLPLMLPYMRRAGEMGFYSFALVSESLPTFISYFYSRHGSLFWDFNNNIGVQYPAFWDHQIFPGGIALLSSIICCVIFLVKKISRTSLPRIKYDFNLKLVFVAGLVTFLLYLRLWDFSLYRILYPLPGFGSMRALQRIINIELLFMAAAAAFLFSLLLRKKNLVSAFIFLLLVALVIMDNRVHQDTVLKEEKTVVQQRETDLLSKIKNHNSETILSYEPDSMVTKQIYYQIDAMMAAQTLRIKTLNGYSATSPKGYKNYWNTPNEESRREWLREKNLSEENILVVR